MAKFWELFKKIEESSEDKQEEIKSFVQAQAALPEEAKALLEAWKLRRSMWVVTPDGLGIVTGVYKDYIEVMLVDDSGQNKKQQTYEPKKLAQAKLGQIPKIRRPDEPTALALGYL